MQWLAKLWRWLINGFSVSSGDDATPIQRRRFGSDHEYCRTACTPDPAGRQNPRTSRRTALDLADHGLEKPAAKPFSGVHPRLSGVNGSSPKTRHGPPISPPA